MGISIDFGGFVGRGEDEGKKHRSAGRRWWNSAIPQNQWTCSENEHEKTYASAQTLSRHRL